MEQEFEVVSHSGMNFKMFIVNMIYRTPHIHKDFEICYVLDGEIEIINLENVTILRAGSFYIMNPFQSHEIKAKQPALLLSLQVSPNFFAPYYPKIDILEFTTFTILEKDNPIVFKQLQKMILNLSQLYFTKKDFYEFQCASLITQIFFLFLNHFNYKFVSEKERLSSKNKAVRMRKIIRYIDEHYSEKLLLSYFAEQEGLSLYYLSHLFKDNFGISFQDYLMKLRCEKARQLLLLSNQSLLDICMSCGFSDSKYFNQGFKRQYGCSPKDYRKNFYDENFDIQQTSILTTEEFMTPTASLNILERYI